MKKFISFVLCILMLAAEAVSFADGLLPSLADTYGVEMPNFSTVLRRKPNAEEQLPDGSLIMKFEGITEEHFTEFSEYIGGFGCSLKEYSVDGDVFTAVVEKQGKTFTFVYDNAQSYAEILYPQNSNPETYAVVGNIITFGNYEQDNDPSNGKEEIEWIILADDGDKVLLISKYAIDARAYNKDCVNVTWEKCSLRTWLNRDFYNSAFSVEEKSQILKSTVSADKNPKYNTDPGNATENNIFLLSAVEADKYFATDEARKCFPTEYAIAQGAYLSSSKASGDAVNCWWWLRSPGNRQNYATRVSSGGSVRYDGHDVNYDIGCVRPALWINLEF